MPRQSLPSLAAILLAAAPAVAEVPAVMTDFAPTQSLVAQVMGNLGQPERLVEQGVDPHSYQLRPSQARALASADLVIWVGPELTPWMERVLTTAPDAQVVGLLANPATILKAYPDEAGHDDGAGADSETHDHMGADPHAWLDPENAKAWIEIIRDALIAADGANADTYTRNADVALAEIEVLEAETAGILAPAKGAPIVVGHNAYGYFADHFGLTIAASIEAGDAAAAGAAHLSKLRARLAGKNISCLFPEAGHDPKQSVLLVEGTNVRLGQPLDPEGLLLPPGPDLYGALIRGLATSIAVCATSQG